MCNNIDKNTDINMSCCIYSESEDVPIDFWNYIDYDEQKIRKKMKKRFGNGFFVKIENVVYIVSCFHIIERNNMKNIVYYNYEGKKNVFEAKQILYMEEYDISILIPKYNVIINHYYTVEELDNKLDCIINSKSYIQTYLFNNSLVRNEYSKIECHYMGIMEEKVVSNILFGHEIPCINVLINEKIDINGMSGSLIFIDDKPMGMIIANKKNIISSLPLCLIIKLIQINKNKNEKMGSIIFSSNICEIILENTTKFSNKNLKNIFKDKKINGHYILDSHDISYVALDKNKKEFNFNFMKSDIIIMIDNKFIEDNGYIYCDKIGYNIKISTYFLLNMNKNEYHNIVICRNDNIDVYKIKSNCLKNMIPYNIGKKTEYCYYGGFVFAELSDRMLEYFKEKNILIYGEINSIQKVGEYKYVVLVNINYDYIKNNYKNKYEELMKRNFPFDNNKILILNKIGNVVIQNLNFLETLIYTSKISNTKQTFLYNENENKNTEIKSITLENNTKSITFNFFS